MSDQHRGNSCNEFGSVKAIELAAGMQAVEIKHKNCSGKVSLYGGQVLSWQPARHKPVLWLSEKADFTLGKAIRGGIPLCWPWFGPYQEAGNHGFARLKTWQLDSVCIDPQGVTLVLSWQGENIHTLWPSAFELKQTLVFGEEFSQSLQMMNMGEHDVQYSGALHSYFQLSSAASAQLSCLSAVAFDDKLTGLSGCRDNLKSCTGPFDRIYDYNKAVVLQDNNWQRSITITPFNSAHTVVWNPGEETAKSIKDLHQSAENEFVCIEPANTQWQTLEPGKAVTLGQTIQVSAQLV